MLFKEVVVVDYLVITYFTVFVIYRCNGWVYESFVRFQVEGSISLPYLFMKCRIYIYGIFLNKFFTGLVVTLRFILCTSASSLPNRPRRAA